MTAKRIFAAIFAALILAAGAGAVASSGTTAPVAAAPASWYHA